MQSHGGRAVERCYHLAQKEFSETEGELFRFWLGKAHQRTIVQVTQWMQDAGMTVRGDAVGSVIGRYEGTYPQAPALIFGSHLDTVRNGGAFDGVLGVMLGIELVAALHASHKRYPFAIEVVGFGDEEGSRFSAPMIASRAMAGVLHEVPEGIVDAQGLDIAQAMAQFGLDSSKLTEAARSKADSLAFIETHIEQGPCIEDADGMLAVVTAIAAQLRQRVIVQGQGAHAGTTPMDLRRDALAGAAEMIGLIEAVARQCRNKTVATVGQISVESNASNVIAQDVWFSLDIRAETDEARDQLAQKIYEQCRDIAAQRHLKLSLGAPQLFGASECDNVLTGYMAKAVERVTGQSAQYLLSGAGHDTMALSHLCPTAMLFIRSPNGISHHPHEMVRVCDVEAAYKALMMFLEEFAHSQDISARCVTS